MIGSKRPLRPAEIGLLTPVFGERIPYGAVRLRHGHGGNPAAMLAFRNGNSAITLRRSIYFRIHYRRDFAQGGVAEQALFLHEMAHVWQFAALGSARFLARYALDLAACRFSPRAMYEYEEGLTPFAQARLEAQAQMVGDYCHASLIGDAPRRARLERNLLGSGLYDL